MIRAGVGLSLDRRSTHAAAEAAEMARASLGGAIPDWCVVFASAEHGEHLSTLLPALANAAGTPYVTGCSAAGILAGSREIEGGPALGVLAVASDAIRGTPFLFHDDGDQGLTAGIRVGQRFMTSQGTGDLVLAWPDPYHVRPDRLLQGMNATLGAVPVAGGAASSNGEAAETFQFCGNESSTSAVSGLRLGGEFRRQVAITQGCRPLCEPMIVTRSHENLILEVEGQPALDVLRRRAPTEIVENPNRIFSHLFVGLLPESDGHPVMPGEYLIRNIVAADPDTGVVAIADSVEEGQSILFAVREPRSAREDLSRMLDRVRAQKGDLTHRFGLYFNCLARGASLYGKSGVDAEHLAQALPGVPILGFFCNAEMAPLRGVNHLFTYTGVLVLVGE
jgi:small ligand-binding sensory domain FIST